MASEPSRDPSFAAAYAAIEALKRQRRSTKKRLATAQTALKQASKEVLQTQQAVSRLNLEPDEATMTARLAVLEEKYEKDIRYAERVKELAAMYDEREHGSFAAVSFDSEAAETKRRLDKELIDQLKDLKTSLRDAIAKRKQAAEEEKAAARALGVWSANWRVFLRFVNAASSEEEEEDDEDE
jgi:hypothetical protein